MSGSFTDNNEIRALIGSFCFVGGMVCFWFCAYKCIICLKEKEERDRPSIGSRNRDRNRPRIHVNPPRVYTSTEVSNYQSGLTVIPNKMDRQFRSLV